MLHHEQIRRAIAEQAPHVVHARQRGCDDIQRLWDLCCHDADVGHDVSSYTNQPCATWTVALRDTYYIPPIENAAYRVYAIDGSQIYPDPHRCATACALNIGYVDIQYGYYAHADINAYPYTLLSDTAMQTQYVDRMRLVHEIYMALQTPCNAGVMFDGPLTWWPLLRTDQLVQSMMYLEQLAERAAWYIGYTSSPQSSHVTNSLRAIPQAYCVDISVSEHVEHITDVQLMTHVLPRWHRTQMMLHTDPVCTQYPEYLRPCMCYINTGDEIARIEIPRYIASSPERVDAILTTVRDQIEKGNGYPVALAEAHETAVVREHDRQFFFAMLAEHTMTPAASRKQNCKHRPLI